MSLKPPLIALITLIGFTSVGGAAEPVYRRWATPLPPLYRAAVLELFSDHDRALSAADEAVAAMPDNPATWGLRSRIHSLLHNSAAALDDATEAERSRPDEPYLRFLRGYAYGDLERYEEALADATVVVRQRPDWAPGWRLRAKAFDRLHNHPGAQSDIERALRLDPDDLEAQTLNGLFTFMRGDARGAIEKFTSILWQHPNDAAVYTYRATCYAHLQDLTLALRDVDQAIQIRPDSAWAHYCRCVIHYQRKEWAAALADAEFCLRSGEEYRNLQGYHARVLQELKRYPEAIQVYTQILQNAPEDANTWAHRATCNLLLSRYPEAAADSHEALLWEPDHLSASQIHYQAVMRMGNYSEAFAESERCLQMEPNSPLVHCDRAAMFWILQEDDKAEAELAKAFSLDHRNGRAWGLRLRFALRGGNPEKVLTLGRQLLLTESQDPSGLILRGLGLCMTGKHVDAWKDATEALKDGGTQPIVLVYHGLIAAVQGRSEAALVDANACLQEGNKEGIPWFVRGLAHVQQRSYAAAARDLGIAYVLDPNLFHSRGLVMLVRQMGHVDTLSEELATLRALEKGAPIKPAQARPAASAPGSASPRRPR